MFTVFPKKKKTRLQIKQYFYTNKIKLITKKYNSSQNEDKI